MTRVAVLGAGGRMGLTVCQAVASAPDLELAGAVDPVQAGTALDMFAGGLPALEISETIDELIGRCDVVVDFTVAAAAKDNLMWCAANGVHAVVGTTGLSEADLEGARAAFEASPANAVVAANFAIGAVLLVKFAELAAPYMDGVEIIELHHNAKRDAPSGTALATARAIESARTRSGTGEFGPDPTTDVVVSGARGAVGPGDVHIHSVRLPGLVAHEEVVFGAEGQSLSLRHDSYDRVSFMPGVLLAVRRVAEFPGLTFGLAPFLDLDARAD